MRKMKRGILFSVRSELPNFLMRTLLVLVVVFILALSISNEPNIYGPNGVNATQSPFGFFLALYQGCEEPSFNLQSPVDIPEAWFLIQILLAILVGAGPACKLSTCGFQDTLRMQSRISLWASKCIIAFADVVVFYLLLAFGSIVYVYLRRSASVFFIWEGMNICVLLFFLSLPCLSYAVSLAQAALSIVAGRMLSFLCIVSFYIASTFTSLPFMIGDYSMLLRSTISSGQNSAIMSLCYSAELAAISICVACYVIRRKNLLRDSEG
ncbi:hypothetical protein [Eggerthella sinensis]|uniref:hypothetical protein n=1 Tax=Eggerthella sinensis TaxID=242230 RepID=UPI0022DEE13D|nr:hypothetical protein [Eggerthella sinensis]